MSDVHVALLRGINVGGHRKVPMARLRDALAGAGFDGVRTHLQSGNVLVQRDAPPDAVARELEAAIAAEFGFDVDVVVRTRDELAEVVAADPLLEQVTSGKLHHVVFLSGPPDPAARRRLEEADWGDEQLAFGERELYAWYPGGFQRSPLGAAIARADLGVVATGRNWNTVTKLLELAGG